MVPHQEDSLRKKLLQIIIFMQKSVYVLVKQALD